MSGEICYITTGRRPSDALDGPRTKKLGAWHGMAWLGVHRT